MVTSCQTRLCREAITLTGGAGINDAMIGNGGNDIFVLEVGGGADRVLGDADLAALRDFTARIPGWFRNMPPEARAKAVADVEFGFIDNRLILFQIRPFVENAGARANARLLAMDESLRSSATREVDMNAMPGGQR